MVASVVPSYMRGDIFVKGVPQFSPEEWGDIVDDGTQFVSDGVANALNHGGTRGDIIPVGVAVVTARGRRGNLLFTIGDNVTGIGEKSGDVTHGQGVTVMNECMTRMRYASPAVIRGPLERSSRIIVAKAVWGEHAPENPTPVYRRVPQARRHP